MKRKRGKKGQFFLIMAVVMGALLLSATALFNTSETKDTALEQFNLICENYYYEAQHLHKEFIGQPPGETFIIELRSLTEKFEEEYNVNDEDKFEIEYDYDTTGNYQTFSFTMNQTKGNEVYFCEK